MSESIMPINNNKGTPEQKNAIFRKEIRRNILWLAWPVIFEMALATFADITNTMIVGNLGIDSMNSIQLTSQPLMLGMVIFQGFGVSATALIARFIGEKNKEMANKTFQQSLLGSCILALFLVSVLYFIAPLIMIWMGAENTTIIKLGTSYIRCMLFGLFCQWQFTVISASLRGAGDTKTPMFTNTIIYLLNVIGSLVLVFGIGFFPTLGVMGAGIASSIARASGFAFVLAFISSGRAVLKINWQEFFKFDWILMRRILHTGAPAAGEQAFLRIGQTFYSRVVNTLGKVAVAAHNTAITAESLSYMPGWGFSIAATTLVGQKLGEGKPEEAEACAIESMKFAGMIMGCMAIVFLAIPELLMALFDLSHKNGSEFIRLGAQNLRIVAIAQIPQAVQFVLAGALRGAGYTRPVLYSTLVGVWVGRLLFAYIFVVHFGWGLAGAWVAMCIDWFFRSGFVVYLWKKGQWKYTQV